ncbi:putative Syntaxin 5 [Leptomonas pyrrhocoris]|uniref:Putative Syntaxin 5 n=1 Tax=Leptomonas pyrrhocoris TaxID=157538 RepID=A0A0M9G811_LEPPY|nr:putative Syntaxin 5 [Leptomonas pyrrhocoris]KPA84483.1 putative Syntaxin 5 [Leptomonas pyrrhocoris]|eukprot:XP_015662922.1 putative Syntaxin 5 [Leptomonas pyrrhocoris]
MVVERDRSNELYDLFSRMRQRQPQPATTTAVAPGLHSSSDVQTFNRFAKEFSTNIATVSEYIMRLTQLTNQQSVFDDQTAEVSELTQIVKTSLQRLHNDAGTLEELKRRAMTSQKNTAPTSTGHLRTAEKHSDTVVETLRSRLARTGQQFRTTLQHQSKSLKDKANRRHMFTTADRPQTFESALFQDQEQHQQQQQLLAGTGNIQYYQQRADAVMEIEAAVQEVGELFNDFTRLVQEQEEVVLRIDTDVGDAVRHVNAGSNELMRYLTNLSSNRGLILKVFAMLFFFLMFFGLIVVR